MNHRDIVALTGGVVGPRKAHRILGLLQREVKAGVPPGSLLGKQKKEFHLDSAAVSKVAKAYRKSLGEELPQATRERGVKGKDESKGEPAEKSKDK